ncbi:helix-turn-helix domain-containing protein [Paenibacillus sp. J5C2022]|uniref:helix-turn-helix domain-containing protein n=1 Tax=Paenibacillus sp. J5C2022 TaxID=2977129 RepID=UPI0021D3C8F8|nr:helix-turn-helix domain-containing protein [Paenibacillus sp. J5C2022]
MERKSTDQSLFMKIFLSFLSIIVLFTLFHIFSFAFIISNVQKRVIASNQQLLAESTDKFDYYFSRVQMMLHSLYNDKAVSEFAGQLRRAPQEQPDYWLAKDTVASIRRESFNPYLYLQALIIQYGSASVTLDQAGSSSEEDMFGRAYASSDYPLSFWKEPTRQTFRLLPAASFHRSDELREDKLLLPYAFEVLSADYRVIALIDIQQVLGAFFTSDESRALLIRDREGKTLLATGGQEVQELPTMDGDSGYLHAGDSYYFWQTDSEGRRYISSVPQNSIASQAQKLSLGLLLIAAMSIVIALFASYVFSNRIHRPVKRMLSELMHPNADQLNSGIKEFNLIHANMRELVREKASIQEEIARHSSILTSYGYMNKLKSINHDIQEWNEFLAMDESYHIVLYTLRLRPAGLAASQIPVEKALYALREHIGFICTGTFPDSHTFQMEKDQILSVIKGRQREGILNMLRKLKSIVDRDHEYYLVTAAVSSHFEHSSQFNYAYDQVIGMSRRSLLLEEMQIFADSGGSVPATIFFNNMQQQELHAAIQSGQPENMLSIVERRLDELHEKQATAEQFRKAVEEWTAKLLHSLERSGVAAQTDWQLKSSLRQLGECCTLAEYKDGFRRLFWHAGGLMQERAEQIGDPVINRVLQIVDEEYREELSLDYLSGKLNMSSAYLSAYIKEKTGENFTEHLNRTRLRNAQQLLAQTEGGIADIGKQVGYHNASSFNRMFKKWTGQSPSEYRRSVHFTEEAEG